MKKLRGCSRDTCKDTNDEKGMQGLKKSRWLTDGPTTPSHLKMGAVWALGTFLIPTPPQPNMLGWEIPWEVHWGS